jgi:hypothetical protein
MRTLEELKQLLNPNGERNGKWTHVPVKKQYTADITYIRDGRTGLCFAERGMSNSYSFTCVPCDSVKKYIK